MKSIIAGSSIVGVALIVASLINSGEVSFKDRHIIPVTGGAVKLGEVYDEHQIVSAKLIFNDKDSADETLLEQANSGDYKDTLKNKLGSLSNMINAANKSEDKVTADNLSVKKLAKLEITVAVRYRSEYQPSFTLVVGSKTIDIPANAPIYKLSVDSVDSFLHEKKAEIDSSLFLK